MSTATIFFHQTVAEKAGLSGSDHKYLDLLFQEGAMTAGKLAELSGLTTGAVTGIIDRLEKQDLVKRKRDPADRRKVLVVPLIENAKKRLGPVFETFQTGLIKQYEKYSEGELQVIRNYLLDTVSLLNEQTQKLRSEKYNRRV